MSDWIILVIDSEQDSRRFAVETLRAEGYTVLEAESGESALRMMRETPPHLILLDLALTDTNPERILRMLKKKNPQLDVILTTRQRQIPPQANHPDVDDYIEKPVDPSDLMAKVRSLEIRHQFLQDIQFIGKNEHIIQMMETVLQVAPTDIQVLITGESGTGKDVIAQAIHEHSRRRHGPFIPVNCGAIAEGVIESELFGHERGAFTGATGRRQGMFEQADGGTILLDEIAEMPLATQVKLLRVLEEQQFLRVGGNEPTRTDVRIVAATNKNLEDAIHDGTFRRDLYYRLNVVHIHLPALRERRDDIPRLIDHFVSETTQKHQVAFAGFTEETLAWLMNYNWPGNIRELRNIIDRLAVTMNGRKVRLEDLPESIYRPSAHERSLPVVVNRNREELEREMLYKILWDLRVAINELPAKVVEALHGHGPLTLPERFNLPADFPHATPPTLTPIEPVETTDEPGTWEEIEKDTIRRVLDKYNGHREKAAKHLEIGVRTLYRKIEKYGLDEQREDNDR